jgi:signal transduction histidine kinase
MKESKEALPSYAIAHGSRLKCTSAQNAVIYLQNEEREYVVTQLRDNIAQVLTSCKLLLETVQDRDDPSTFIEKVNKYLLQAVSDVTSLSYRIEGTDGDSRLFTV